MGKSTEREDEKISKLNKRISSEKSRKNMAKKRGQKERIEEKTKSLRMKNRELNRTIRTKLGENDLPTFCNSTWFYVLYCTEGLIEWLIKLTFFAVMFLLIPMLCVCFVDWHIFFKGLLFILVFIIDFAIYITIFLVTKDRDNGTLEELRKERDGVKDNKKEIKKIKKGIKADKDESIYDLDSYDKNIRKYQEELDELEKDREKNLKDFKDNKKDNLVKEIEDKHNEEIEKINKLITEEEEKVVSLENALNENKEKIQAENNGALPESLINKYKIKKIIGLIESKEVKDIESAVNKLGR